jgi:hypothetical protein
MFQIPHNDYIIDFWVVSGMDFGFINECGVIADV